MCFPRKFVTRRNHKLDSRGMFQWKGGRLCMYVCVFSIFSTPLRVASCLSIIITAARNVCRSYRTDDRGTTIVVCANPIKSEINSRHRELTRIRSIAWNCNRNLRYYSLQGEILNALLQSFNPLKYTDTRMTYTIDWRGSFIVVYILWIWQTKMPDEL